MSTFVSDHLLVFMDFVEVAMWQMSDWMYPFGVDLALDENGVSRRGRQILLGQLN